MEVSDKAGSSNLTLHPETLIIDNSGTATGRVRVADTGVPSQIDPQLRLRLLTPILNLPLIRNQ